MTYKIENKIMRLKLKKKREMKKNEVHELKNK
jgi:hypothetical protein